VLLGGAQLNWPHYRNRNDVWTFEPEHPTGLASRGVEEFDWAATESVSGLWLPTVVTALIRKHLRTLSLERGLKEAPDRKHYYFPFEPFANSWLTFRWPPGGERRLRGAGERRFRIMGFGTEVNRYHLSMSFIPALARLHRP